MKTLPVVFLGLFMMAPEIPSKSMKNMMIKHHSNVTSAQLIF
jgi:hypothetical protein